MVAHRHKRFLLDINGPRRPKQVSCGAPLDHDLMVWVGWCQDVVVEDKPDVNPPSVWRGVAMDISKAVCPDCDQALRLRTSIQ